MKNSKGQQAASGPVVLNGSAVQRMRCPKCNAMTTAGMDNSGKPSFQCGSCGRKFSVKAL
jgi:transposase-like protein